MNDDECPVCGGETAARGTGRYLYRHCLDCGHVGFDDLDPAADLWEEDQPQINLKRATLGSSTFHRTGWPSLYAQERWSRQP